MARDLPDGIAMQQPYRFFNRMMLFLIIVGLIVAVLAERLEEAFQANLALNGLIVGVLGLGVLYAFRQVIMLWPEIRWVNTFRRADPGLVLPKPPVLLAPMATMLGERKGPVSLNALTMRSILDSLASRLDESRELLRYMVGLLIFLGLLGTFWGLLETVSSVGNTIRTLSVDGTGGDPTQMFAELRAGLEAPLSGMGTAFSSSLFGLAGSLVLGFLDLQSGQAQNRFYNDLEEWLSTVTRLSAPVGGIGGDGGDGSPAYASALFEQAAESLQALQYSIDRGEDNRAHLDQNILALTERLATLADMMHTEQNLMMKVAEMQQEMRPVLERLAHGQNQGLDEVTGGHIRNIDVAIKHLADDAAEGRDHMLRDLKNEIKILTKTVASLGSRR